MTFIMTYEERVKNKCTALLKLITGIQEFYKTSNDDNKRFTETTIGAAIWYLPKDKKVLFTGKISKEAIQRGEKSEDHPYPRKIAATELLNFKWDSEVDAVETLAHLFMNKYGKYNYVAKRHGSFLVPIKK